MSAKSIFQAFTGVRRDPAKPLTKNMVLSMLNDAVWAPNYKLTEPWRFIIAEDAVKQSLADAIGDAGHLQAAKLVQASPFVLAVAAAKVRNWEDDNNAVCCLVQNFHLLIQANGYPCTTLVEEAFQEKAIKHILQIKPDEYLTSLHAMGYPEGAPACKNEGETALFDKIMVW